MSDQFDAMITGYYDGTLSDDDAQRLAAALSGSTAFAMRERVLFPSLLAQAFIVDDAVVRSVSERIDADRAASTMVRAVQRSITTTKRRRRPARTYQTAWLAAASLAIALLTAVIVLSDSHKPQVICHVTQIGDAHLHRNGSRVAVFPGMGLVVGDHVKVSSKAKLTWDDGSIVTLNPGSEVDIPREQKRFRLTLRRGQLDADITPQQSGFPFAISTSSAQISVLGTQFQLRADEQQTTCDLHHGAVRMLRLSDQQDVDLTAGQTATIAAHQPFIASLIKTLTDERPWQPLFTSVTLSDWQQQHGTWTFVDDVVRGQNAAGGKVRMMSHTAYQDLELNCRIRILGAEMAEVQVGDYNWFVEVPARGTSWVEIHVRQQGKNLQVTADGVELIPKPGAGVAMRPGPISFYVMPGGTLEITAARLRQ